MFNWRRATSVMPDRTAWSVTLGRWHGVSVRLHGFFVFFVAAAYLANWQFAESGITPLGNILTASFFVLFFSVLLHEFGHAWWASRHGHVVDQIVIGPLGGMAPIRMPGNPKREFQVHLAGPTVNLVVCALCIPALLAADIHVLGLINPLDPRDLTLGGPLELTLKLTFWINWCLLLLNLLPAFPLDGAYALQAAFLARRPELARRQAAAKVARVAQFMVLLVLLWCIFMPQEEGQWLLSMRFVLIPLAVFLLLSTRLGQLAAERAETGPWGEFEFSGSLAMLEHELEEAEHVSPGPLRRWLQRRRQTRLRRQREGELEEDSRVDDILARLYQEGMQSLTREDRALLQRASVRYRSRLGL